MESWNKKHKVLGGQVKEEPNGWKTIECGSFTTELGEYSIHYVVDDERYAQDVFFKKKGS